MTVTGKTIKEDLSRCKAAYLKNDDLRALGMLAAALKGFVSVKLPGTERAEIESQLREAFSNISKVPRVLKLAPKGLPYLKGQEPKLFQYVAAVYRKVKEEIERESLEQMRERKLRIDQCIIKGQKLLNEDNLLEAQRNFREAVSLRVDEDGLFPMLALKLMDKGHFKPSLEYLKGAIEASPDNARAFDLLVTASAKMSDPQPGLKLLDESRKKVGETPLILAATAQLKAQAGEWEAACALAGKALEASPGLDMAAKVLSKAKKAGKA